MNAELLRIRSAGKLPDRYDLAKAMKLLCENPSEDNVELCRAILARWRISPDNKRSFGCRCQTLAQRVAGDEQS
jgi:hypothetical protein